MDNIEVSVIIPVYNGAKYIGKAIDSALNQNVSLEIIIIDDCSSDNIYEVITPFLKNENIKYYKNQINIGVAESRNIGVKVAKGKYVAYLDADDWWNDNKLVMQIKILNENTWKFCFTSRIFYSEDNGCFLKKNKIKEIVDYRILLKHNYVTCSSVLIDRNTALEFPMQHSNLHEDYITWLSILKNGGRAYGINETHVIYRVRKNSKSGKKIKSYYSTMKSLYLFESNKFKLLYYALTHLVFHYVNTERIIHHEEGI